MVVRLSDATACEETPKPCGCGGGCNGQAAGYGQPVININVDSNNKEGYNTLNPGSITRETIGYPVNAQVVNPQVVDPKVINNPSIPSGTISTGGATSPVVVPKMPAVQHLVKKQRVFYPEFL